MKKVFLPCLICLFCLTAACSTEETAIITANKANLTTQPEAHRFALGLKKGAAKPETAKKTQ
jgi:Mg2+/Co2+ transporter CorB